MGAVGELGLLLPQQALPEELMLTPCVSCQSLQLRAFI